MRRAKILATLGPASREPATLEALLAAGANAFRINMSHGTQEEHAETIRRARAAAERMRRPLAILVDLSGPKIRTGVLQGGQPVMLEENALFTLTTRSVNGDAREVSTNYPGLARDVHPGARILLDDGAIALNVERTTETDVVCRVINGGLLNERKGINLPGVVLPIPSLTDKDRRDLQFAVRAGADYIALSFVRRAEDCLEAKALIKASGGKAPLVAKIEKSEAIDHLAEIINASDGVMVARGDLGVETSVELVPVYQKRIIEEANEAGKFVITATQMLQSMITEPRPTRAEASDVANAVWDGSDALMLSAETATGAYPVATVATMARIIEAAETGRSTGSSLVAKWAGKQSGRVSRAICEAAAFAAEEMGAKVIAVFTESGLMARRLSALRPAQRIAALTHSREVLNELAIIWAVEPYIYPPPSTTEGMIQAGDRTLMEAGIVQHGQVIVLMAGRLSGLGLSSSMTLHAVGEDISKQP
ncbi:MAG TPA: pyruvate kinase [Pyrinomonadaceae bacterium]|jgi:pyruvate kinase|nr:pyruvate kinase [Pyrinomonadaceae bacterium]